MKRLTLFIALLCWGFTAFAQDLHIYFDLQTETPRYVMDSQVVTRPYVRRGASVILHIENYNNYLYDVVIEQENREIRLPANATPSSLSSIFPALGKNSTDFFSLLNGGTNRSGGTVGNSGGSRNLTEPVSFDDKAALSLNNQEVKEINEALKAFDTGVAKIENIKQDINAKSKRAQSLVEAHQINAFLIQEIDNIKYDPALKPAQIKKMTREYMNKALNLNTDATVAMNLDSLLSKGNTRLQLIGLLDDVKMKHDEYRNEKAKLNAIKEDLNANFGNKLLVSTRYVAPVLSSYEDVESQETVIAALENNLLQLVTQIPDADLTKLATIWRQYEELLANSFTKNHRSLADGDDMVFNIRLAPNSTGSSKQMAALQLAPIQVPVAGGFKVNASVGVAFGQLFNQPKSYFVRDSIIRSEDKDSFVPVIASFFHFYGLNKGTVSVGGNFGIGLPITGDAVQSASFFLGPSLIIGRGDRLVINGGFMGTRVERLAQGFNTGDRFRSQVNNVPTKQVYELGYFLGVSFNVLGGGK